MNEHDPRLAEVESFLRRMQPREVNIAPPPAAEPLTLADRILVTIGSCSSASHIRFRDTLFRLKACSLGAH